jgi:hypothetical protein
VLLLSLAGMGAAQQTITVSTPEAPLLPSSFGQWKGAPAGGVGGAVSLASLSKEALEECGPQRSAVADYARGGHAIHVEAIQFGDRTGAFSAFTLVERPDMKQGHDLGASDAIGDGAVLITAGSTVVLVSGATDGDMASLRPLAEGLPKISGNTGVAPLLPSLAPEKGLVAGSLRYALGPATYQAEGGVLPAQSLGWEKSAEAVTAQYRRPARKGDADPAAVSHADDRGELYQGDPGRAGRWGPSFAQREGAPRGRAGGAGLGQFFSAEDAQRLVDDAHLRQEVSFDKDVQPVFHTEVQKTASLLMSIAILSGVLMGAAVLLGLFLGVGRAWIRVLRGKPAAVEVEFLSLHLAPQNKPVPGSAKTSRRIENIGVSGFQGG